MFKHGWNVFKHGLNVFKHSLTLLNMIETCLNQVWTEFWPNFGQVWTKFRPSLDKESNCYVTLGFCDFRPFFNAGFYTRLRKHFLRVWSSPFSSNESNALPVDVNPEQASLERCHSNPDKRQNEQYEMTLLETNKINRFTCLFDPLGMVHLWQPKQTMPATTVRCQAVTHYAK